MDDLVVRIAVVTSVALAVAVVLALMRRRGAAPRRIPSSGLAPGTYLFTSASCDECDIARRRLDRLIGEENYTELAWEADPAVFGRLGVDEAPSTLFVRPDGSGIWQRGVPSRLPAILE